MAIECARCRGRPNIRINVLNYCNTCFISNTTAKVSKLLGGMAHDTPILVYVDGSPAGAMLCDILEQFFSTRRYYRVVACSSGPGMEGRLASAAEYVAIGGQSGGVCTRTGACGGCACCEAELPHPVVDLCLSNDIRTVIYPKTLEDILAGSLRWMCDGDGSRATAAACTESIGEVRAVNPLRTVRDKEVAYYLYVRGIPRPAEAGPRERIGTVLRDFLHETDSRNSLALFNILGALKKLG